MQERWRHQSDAHPSRKRWILWIGVVVSVAALILAVRGIDLDRVKSAFAQADYVYLLPAGFSLLAYLVVRSVRWRILLGGGVSLTRCFWITNVGYLVSNVFPFRLGDPARAVAVGVDGKVKVSATLTTVVVERVLDMLMVVSLLAVSLPFIEEAGVLRQAGLLAAVAAVVALVGLLLAALRPQWIRRLAAGCLGRVPRLDPQRWLAMLDGLLDGLTALRSPRRLAELLFWSVVTWLFVVGYYWAMLWAFLDEPPLVQGAFLTSAIGLGMAIPAAPGAMGVFEAVARVALEVPFGVPTDEAVVVAFGSHAYQYILSNLLGLAGLAQLGLSLKQLRADAAALDEGDRSSEASTNL
jgi:uncharacterized protein (TIRG00374 family)